MKDGNIRRFTIKPEDFGMNRGNIEDIQITETEESAAIIKDVLYNRAGETAASIVTLNAAAGLYVAGKADTLEDGVEQVQQAIQSGRTREYYESIASERENRQYA